MEKLELEPGAVEQHNGYAINYKAWWLEEQKKRLNLEKEVEDLKAQKDRLKAVLKDLL